MNIGWIVSSSVIILFVVLIRYLFRKRMQPCIRYSLWLIVVFRLLIPFSFSETAVSVLNLLPEQIVTKPEVSNREERIENINGEKIEAGYLQTEQSPVRKSDSKTKVIYEGKSGERAKEALKVSFSMVSGKIDVGRVLKSIWLTGAVSCGALFLAINLSYGHRLKRARKKVSEENLPEKLKIPVYIAEMIQTPCLFGTFCPAIYVTEKVMGEEQILKFVLCHENIHYKHHDNWWVFVRNLCLCLHWYHPFVWLAAFLSRQDGELACDEKALKVLGSKARIDYGRALLELGTAEFAEDHERSISSAIAAAAGMAMSTATGGNKKQMKERLQMILTMPGKIVWVRILLLILLTFAAAVGFTGKKGKSFAAAGNGDPTKEEAFQAKAQKENGKERTVSDGQRQEESGTEEEKDSSVREERETVYFPAGNRGNLVLDLNFDGFDDLCLPGQYNGGENVPYYCMIWNEEQRQYEKSVMLYNIKTDKDNKWISSRVKEEDGIYSTTYYRYDEDNRLHMVKYEEENELPDVVFGRFDLTYVDDGGPYTLPAIVDGTDSHCVLIAMAKQALRELYQWTGEKVDTACFQVTDMGCVYFSMAPEDMEHSRVFYDRDFGADTEFNLSNYDKCISSMYVTSARSVWYSPVLWKIIPAGTEKMTSEEIITWYLERIPLVEDCRVKSMEKRYEDTWTVETYSGVWFEVFYDTGLKEISGVVGPYPEYPVH